MNKLIRAIGRDIHSVLRDVGEGSIGRRRRMPIKLQIDATRSLNNRIHTDGIGKRLYDDIRAGLSCFRNCRFYVRDEVAIALSSEPEWNWC
jgi:hypothetical protein